MAAKQQRAIHNYTTGILQRTAAGLVDFHGGAGGHRYSAAIDEIAIPDRQGAARGHGDLRIIRKCSRIGVDVANKQAGAAACADRTIVGDLRARVDVRVAAGIDQKVSAQCQRVTFKGGREEAALSPEIRRTERYRCIIEGLLSLEFDCHIGLVERQRTGPLATGACQRKAALNRQHRLVVEFLVAEGIQVALPRHRLKRATGAPEIGAFQGELPTRLRNSACERAILQRQGAGLQIEMRRQHRRIVVGITHPQRGGGLVQGE